MLQADRHDFTQERGIDREVGFFATQIDHSRFEPAHQKFKDDRQRGADRQGPE